ncbi:MAG TPA: hypothetical protein VFP62_00365 [Burkholderiales bacterium]|nr:hypothetical protein [Burkholderiales bacterium]
MITALKPPPEPEVEQEHPVIAWIAVAAILAAILLISWARVAVHGTGDLEAALSDDPAEQAAQVSAQGDRNEQDAQVEDAVAASRWASAFSP